MACLDTNCLLRWFLDDIPEQRQRVDALLTGQETLAVDDAVIIEAIFALESGAKLTRLTIRGFIDAIAVQPVVMDRSLWSQVLDVWVEHPKLSAVDVYLGVKARINQIEPLYTFDAKMINQLAGAVAVPPV